MCLDLIALSPDDANIWVTGLMALTSGPKGILEMFIYVFFFKKYVSLF